MWSKSEPGRPLWRRFAGRLRRALAPPPPPEPDRTGAPPGFDWRWYLASYTDLAAAGVTDEAGAIRHWREHGCREGRRFAPRRPASFDWLAYVDRFPEARPPLAPPASGRARLLCPSIDSLFLRAWGDLVCWDDAGSEQLLQAWDPAIDYADLFLDGPYQEIRRATRAGRMPWPQRCERCLLLRLAPAGASERWDRSFVRILRVEPSYHCSLDCPGCVPLAVRRGHRGEFQLDPERLDRILADLTAHGLAVDVLDFQGHGEPLLNPRLWEMGRRSRARLGRGWISVTTNAQGRFRPEMIASGFDEIVCAIDGVDAASYEPYRVHGDFDLAWRLLGDLVRARESADRPLRVVWKYVLFEHNAAPAQLLQAQRMARDLGVSELVFVLTRNGPAPRQIQSPDDVPRLADPPPLSFRFHAPSIDDLEARLAEAQRLAALGHEGEAEALAASIERNLQRFYPDPADRPPRHQRLLDALRG